MTVLIPWITNVHTDAYQATIGYLLDRKDVQSTWTLCTGAQGNVGLFAGPAITQGALFSMAAAAASETAGSNVRFNEVYLVYRVEVDSSAEKTGAVKASTFGENYAALLARQDISGSRIIVSNAEEIKNLRIEKKCRAV